MLPYFKCKKQETNESFILNNENKIETNYFLD